MRAGPPRDLDPPPSASPSALDRLAQVACTNTALRRAARRLGQIYDDALAPLNLTSSQARLLWEVHAAGPDGPTLLALARSLAVQGSALTHMLRPLMRDGLVELRPDAKDGRVKRARLTPLGEEGLHGMAAAWLDANARVEKALGEGAAAQLRALADAISSASFLASRTAEGDRSS